MNTHESEIQRNRRIWQQKPLLRQIYGGFYERIAQLIDTTIPGPLVEIGSGIGNLKSHFPNIVSTDYFFNPWLDSVCDAYEIPFADRTISHLILFDVFHHLRSPRRFMIEAKRVLAQEGRLILFEPYIGLISFAAYGAFHREPIAWNEKIELSISRQSSSAYYAAQGNATRVFFRREFPSILEGWTIFQADAFASFTYLLSGGFSSPCFYPKRLVPCLRWFDARLSRWPGIFGARCVIGLTRAR